MTEEDIIKKYEEEIKKPLKSNESCVDTFVLVKHEELKLILDLYQKEKQKNKELENADLTTVYTTGFFDGEQKWKDKIREKIKEYETTINQNKLMSIKVRQHGFAQETIIQNIIRAKIEILKELLGE